MPILHALLGVATLWMTPVLAGREAYVLEDDFFVVNENGSFFDQFDFWHTRDPTHGFVDYKDYDDCVEGGLISNTSRNVIMRADSTKITPKGRPSVRVESKKTYNSGLIVLDLDHMPGSICGSWPAFWTYGPHWPTHGEVDIIEGINDYRANKMTLHTGPGCFIKNQTTNHVAYNPLYSGELIYTRCISGDNGSNSGCQIATRDPATYGDGFNAIGGGTYAYEWTPEYLAMWFFPRGSCPAGIRGPLGESPNPESWGLPLSKFYLTCNIPNNFREHKIVFDITFCGDWAGAEWNQTGSLRSQWPPPPGTSYNSGGNYTGYGSAGNHSCAAQTGSGCVEYVQNNPRAFEEAYWSVNALKVYQKEGYAPAPYAPIGAPPPWSEWFGPKAHNHKPAWYDPWGSTSAGSYTPDGGDG